MADFDPAFQIDDKGKEVYVTFLFKRIAALSTDRICTAHLGEAKFAKQRYEQPDGQLEN